MKVAKSPRGVKRSPPKADARISLVANESELVALSLALLDEGAPLSPAERSLAKGIVPLAHPARVGAARKAILGGADPLGDAFLRLRSASVRRSLGAVYTPDPIVASMLNWADSQGVPARVVDPGAGSGRYLLAAAARFPKAQLVGVELDPIAALMLRANLTVHGWMDRATVVVKDFRKAALPKVAGSTLFIGNPPYVRHHDIGDDWKEWFSKSADKFGLNSSKLAGLHIHFFMRVAQLAKPGDAGAFITSSEWLDVNYGSALRELLVDRLGGVALHVLDARAKPFEDAATTGAITCFKIGTTQADGLLVRAVPTMNALNGLSKGELVPWDRVRAATRWSPLFKPAKKIPSDYIELGELCRVHRGQVTGGNSVWIAGVHASELSDRILVPTITKARDLITAGAEIASCDPLRRVVDIPRDLDELDTDEKKAVERFLKWAKKQGADQSYIAQHRRAWWAVGLKEPAPILSTYMARRAPAFVRNLCGARHINIAHGLYPREPIAQTTLDALAFWLRHNVMTDDGRTYAGGLTKFEPKEIERLWIPTLEALEA